jgi:transcriptional regulator with XRE-family HTH domain
MRTVDMVCTCDAPKPPAPEDGHGELIRAMRLYLGLSQREISRVIPMDRRTFQRIEGGAEPCPTGFLDTMTRLVDTFDDEVEQTIEAAETIGALSPENAKIMGKPPSSVHFTVSSDDDPAHLWTRAVIGRAAVESGLITPTVVSNREVASL